MRFQLRVARAEDVAAIRELIEASVRGLQAADYSTAQREGALAKVFTVDSQLIADGTYFVAFAEGGEVAGCGGWSFRKTLYGGDHQVEQIESETLNPDVDAAKIRAIFVHPDFARKGFGESDSCGCRGCRDRERVYPLRDGQYVDGGGALYAEGVFRVGTEAGSGGWW
jgi:GNAT superfamily N-acetyltransferase